MAIRGCSFISNTASARGLAVTVVGSANISGPLFDGNELSCAVGLYRQDTEEVNGGLHNIRETKRHPIRSFPSRYYWRGTLS